MYTCPNCNSQVEKPTNFCYNCGAPVVRPEQPQPEPPQITPQYQPSQQYQPTQQYQQTQTYYQQPYYHTYQPVQKPSLATRIVGMVMSIAGLAFLGLGTLYTLLGIFEDVAFEFALIFAFFFLPLSIVGLTLSNKCINAGDYSGMCRTGKILGIVGIIVAAVSLFIGLISLSTY